MAKELNNKFEVMAESSSNLLTDANYALDTDRINGVATGVARSELNNTTQRQVSLMVVAIANLIARVKASEDINSAKTIEQLDAFLETAIQILAVSGPGNQIVSVTYNTAGEFRTNISDLTLGLKDKITLQFIGTIPDADLDLDAKFSIDNGSNIFDLVLKDTDNSIKVRRLLNQVADVYINTASEAIINRMAEIESELITYDEIIQSQQTIIPVEGTPFFSGDNAKIEGNTIFYAGENMGFESTLGSEWETLGTVTRDTSKSKSGSASVNLVASGSPTYGAQDFHGQIGDIFYVSIWVYKTSGTQALCAVNPFGARSGVLSLVMETTEFDALSTGVWTRFSTLATATNEGISILFGRNSVATFDANFDNVIVRNLGSNPEGYTAEDLDKIMDFDEGLKSVESPELDAVGKNLFDKSIANDKYYVNISNGTLVSNSDWISTDYIEIKGNTVYVQNTGTLNSAGAGVAYYDKDKNFISSNQILSTNNYSFTTATNARYLRTCTRVSDGGNLDTFQLEEGAVATAYDTYRHSNTKYPNQVLRRVSNGTDSIADYIDPKTNLLYRNVGYDFNDVVQSATSWSIADVDTNTQVFLKNLSSSLGYVTPSSSIILPNISLKIGGTNYTTRTESALLGNDNEFEVGINGVGSLMIRVNKTTYPDTASFEAYLQANDVEFQFELAIPEDPVEVDADGLLLAYKNMTIQILQDNGFSYPVEAEHALNAEESVRSLAAAVQSIQAQIDAIETRLETIEDTLEERNLVTYTRLSQLGISDSDLSSSDFESNIHDIYAEMANNSMMQLDISDNFYPNLEASIKTEISGFEGIVVFKVTAHIPLFGEARVVEAYDQNGGGTNKYIGLDINGVWDGFQKLTADEGSFTPGADVTVSSLSKIKQFQNMVVGRISLSLTDNVSADTTLCLINPGAMRPAFSVPIRMNIGASAHQDGLIKSSGIVVCNASLLLGTTVTIMFAYPSGT